MSGRPTPEAPQWEDAALWIDKAAEDARVARLLMNTDAVSSAAFHVQQALEKLLKALLVAASQNVRRTHNLDDLSAEANRFWPDLIPAVFPLASIDQWYFASRYPDSDDALPALGEIEQALHGIETLFEATRALMPR